MSDSAVIAYEEIKCLLLLGFNGVTYNTTQMANLLLLKKRVYQTVRIKLRVNQWEKMTNFIKWPARSCAWSYWKTRDKISVKGPYTVVWTGLERTVQLRKISAKFGKDRKHLRKGKSYVKMVIKWVRSWRGTGGREPERTGGGSPGEQGVGEGRKRENRGREGENKGREAGAEVKKAIQSLLFITGYYLVKNTYFAKFWNFHLTSTNV